MSDTEPTFTKTGQVTIEAGLDQSGDLAWKSGYEGLNPLEVIGALTVVATRMVFRMVLPNMTKDE